MECRSWDSARVLTIVTYHIRGLQPCHSINVSLSGRLPSSLVRPIGSLLMRMPAAVIAQVMISLMAWCLAILLGACLHTEPWIPCASTSAPHLQIWATQTLQPGRKATATRTVSSVNRSPQEVTGIITFCYSVCKCSAASSVLQWTPVML